VKGCWFVGAGQWQHYFREFISCFISAKRVEGGSVVGCWKWESCSLGLGMMEQKSRWKLVSDLIITRSQEDIENQTALHATRLA
jgi:hypothetical protein